MKGGGFTGSFVGVEKVVFGSFCHDLLKFAAQSNGFRLFTFFDQFIHLLSKRFYVGL